MNPAQFQPLIVTLGFLGIFYFLVIKPQKKKEKEIKAMRDSLRVGDEIISIGGIHGKIIKVKDDYVTIEAGPNRVKLDMARWSIGSVVKKNEKLDKTEVVELEEENITEEE